MLKIVLPIGLLTAALSVLAPVAFATDGYNTPSGDVAGEQSGGVSGALPFTGSDLALYGVLGLAILISGLVLRILAARGRAL